MMYEVYVDGNLLYYPNDETYAILNSKLTLALNEAGSFECDVPTYNLRYDDFSLRKSMIKVLQNGEEIFYGEVREVTNNADFTKHIYAVGELAFLFDSIQGQARYLTSPVEAIKKIIATHNSQVEERKKFTFNGICQGSVNDNQLYFYTNGEDTLTVIREKICNVLDGYIKLSKDTNGKRYIDVVPLTNFGTCTQEIQFGENLLDYSCNMNASDIATCVLPRGAKLEEGNRTADAVEGLDEYLTIKGTSIDAYHKAKNNDYVQLDEAIARFGYVKVVKEWSDVTIADNLKKKAIDWLKSAQYERMTLNLKALDLSQLDANIDDFKLGQQVRIWALPYGIDTLKPVRKKTIYLGELEKNEVVLGSEEQATYTKQASGAVEKLKEEIPETSPILEQAKTDALALLTSTTGGGYVVFKYDTSNSYIEEIYICNNKTVETSTEAWLWNKSGFGHLRRTKTSDAWSKVDIAITMDGKIVANYITSGVLKLAGNANDKTNNAYLEVYNGANKVGSWSKDGIEVKQGSINLGNGNFTVDNNGNIAVKQGSIALGNHVENGVTTSNFSVDANGYLVCYNAGIRGNIEAKTGVIGSASDNWKIGEKSIYNGCTGVLDNAHAGTYVGTDGIRSVNTKGQYVLIYNGSLSTNTNLQANSVSCSNVTGDVYYTKGVSGSLEVGQDATISFKGYKSGDLGLWTLRFDNGLLTYQTFKAD